VPHEIRDILTQANQKFGNVHSYVTRKFESLSFSLQAEITEIVTDLIEKGIRSEVLDYVNKPMHLRDGTTVQGQSAFERLVKEDKDIYALIERYRPSKLWYVRRARSIKDYISWDSRGFAAMIAPFLEESGISVDRAGFDYLVRTCDRFRAKIYGR
jgi:hypothetical protein